MHWCLGVAQLWVFCNRDKRCVVLAWRGTEQLKWKDLLTDVRLAPTGFNVERVRGWGGGGRDAPSAVSTPWNESQSKHHIKTSCDKNKRIQ